MNGRSAGLINRRNARILTRISWITAGGLLAGTVLMNWVSDFTRTARPQVILPRIMAQQIETLAYPTFHEMTSGRDNLFEYRILPLMSRKQEKEEKRHPPAPVTKLPPPPQRPIIDAAGLTLVGTVQGTGASWAILEDSRAGRTLVVAQGDEIRGSGVIEVGKQHIVLALDRARKRIVLQSPWKNGLKIKTEQTAVASPTVSVASMKPAAGAVKRKTKAIKKRKRLGISVRTIGYLQRQELGLKNEGLLITASRRPDVDVKKGDILLEIGGKKVGSLSEVISFIRGAGEKALTLTLLREGKRLEVVVPLQ